VHLQLILCALTLLLIMRDLIMLYRIVAVKVRRQRCRHHAPVVNIHNTLPGHALRVDVQTNKTVDLYHTYERSRVLAHCVFQALPYTQQFETVCVRACVCVCVCVFVCVAMATFRCSKLRVKRDHCLSIMTTTTKH